MADAKLAIFARLDVLQLAKNGKVEGEYHLQRLPLYLGREIATTGNAAIKTIKILPR